MLEKRITTRYSSHYLLHNHAVGRGPEKDRSRRYETANGLAMDIERHLRNQPVIARPPSTVYRILKFVRRHKAGVAAAAIVAVALVVGIVVTTVGLVRLTRAEAETAREAEAARQVSDFLVGLFQVSDPEEARGETISAREVASMGATRTLPRTVLDPRRIA
jgi:hypothetical protein